MQLQTFELVDDFPLELIVPSQVTQEVDFPEPTTTIVEGSEQAQNP
jgi:hypothetical protein